MDTFQWLRLASAMLVATGCLMMVWVAWRTQREYERQQAMDRDWQRMWHERIWDPGEEIR